MDAFHHLHEHPEIGWEEHNTTDYLKGILEKKGCRVRTFPHSTGVIAEIGEGKPVVAVRADMDALWQEVNGKFLANHSCGHDAHMAMVLGVIHVLRKLKDLPKGTIRFIYQPAEEKGNGAIRMVEEGVVDDVDYLFGVHLRPIQELPCGKASPAIVHGAARHMSGKIIGVDLHGGRPHLGANAIEVGATLVHLLQLIHIDPMIPTSIKMTSFHAGGMSPNIIPGNASFSLDLRAQKNEAMDLLADKVHEQIRALQQLYHVKIQLKTEAEIAAAVVNKEAQGIMEEAIQDVLGPENTEKPLVTPGGDDFHFYTILRPHIKATMLGLGCDLTPGLHHPHMSFDHSALLDGTHILVKAIILTLEKHGSE